MRELMDYLVKKDLLDILFASNDHDDSKKEFNRILRGGWISVFKTDKQ